MSDSVSSVEALRSKTRAEVGACHFDFSARPSIQDLIQRCGSVDDGGVPSRSAERLEQALGFGNQVTESEILAMYCNTRLEDQKQQIVFVLKLGLALLAYGQCSVDAEIILQEVCEQLGLPDANFTMSSRMMQASFGTGPTHTLRASMDLMVDKLLDITALATHMSHVALDINVALNIMDEIVERPPPYGWLVHVVNLECVCSWAALAAFMGSWTDFKFAIIATPFSLLVQQFCKRFNLGSIELLLCAMMTGVVVPLIERYLIPEPLCHLQLFGHVLF